MYGKVEPCSIQILVQSFKELGKDYTLLLIITQFGVIAGINVFIDQSALQWFLDVKSKEFLI